jgi:hypothetical protein
LAWTRDTSSGSLTLATSGVRTFYAITAAFPSGRVQADCGLASTAHDVFRVVRSSALGDTCIEVGTTGGNLVIRKREFGAILTTLATTPHLIPTGQPYTLRLELNGDSITASVFQNPDTPFTATWSGQDLLQFSANGFASEVNGAVVSWNTYAVLTDRITTLGEVGVYVSGGNVWDSLTPGSWRLVQAGTFSADAEVSMASLAGKMFIIGGGRAKVYDPLTRTVVDWTPTTGTLPGQTTAGTTTGRFIVEHLGGLVIDSPPIGIKGCKINDPFDWLTGTRLFGGAFEYGVGDNATVPDAIVGLAKGQENTLFVPCTNSVNYLLGDPYRGTAQIVTRSQTVGGSGNAGMAFASSPAGDHLLLMHSPDGLHLVYPGGGPVNLSGPVLTKHITFPASERAAKRVVLARDPTRRWLLIFIGGQATQLIYSEDTGRYVPGRGGFFPIDIPVEVTAAAFIRGELHLATTLGWLVKFDDAATNDIADTVQSRITAELVDWPGTENDACLHDLHAVLGRPSSPAFLAIYGSATAEGAYTPSDRRLLWQIPSVGVGERPRSVMARAPYMIVEMSNSGLGERLVVERVQGTASRADLSIGRYWGDEPVIGTPCAANPRTGSLPSAPPPPPVPPPPPSPPAEPSTTDPVFIFTEFGEFVPFEALAFAASVPTFAGGPTTPEGPVPGAGGGGSLGPTTPEGPEPSCGGSCGGSGVPTFPESPGGTEPGSGPGGGGGGNIMPKAGGMIFGGGEYEF